MLAMRNLTPQRRRLAFCDATIGGRRVAWVERASNGRGAKCEPLILIPGLSMSWRAYSWLLDELPAERTVLVIDPPGSGRSQSLLTTMNAENQALQVAAWLDWRGVKCAVVLGHSMGAMIGARLSARRPDLVASLTMVSPSPDAQWPHFYQHIWAMVRGADEETPRTFLQAATDYVRANPRVLVGFANDMSTPAAQIMDGVRCPVTVVRGTDDKVSSRTWCEALAAATSGELLEVGGAAHGLPQQAPAALAWVLSRRREASPAFR